MANINPGVDFQTRGQQNGRAFYESLYAYQDDVIADTPEARLTLDLIVGGGKAMHRAEFTKAFRGFNLPSNQMDWFANRTYDLFCMVVRARARQEYGLIGEAQQLATQALDHTVLESPPTETEQQIELVQSLEVDSASSDDGRRLLYGRDMWPEKALDEMKDEALRKLGVTAVAPDVIDAVPTERHAFEPWHEWDSDCGCGLRLSAVCERRYCPTHCPKDAPSNRPCGCSFSRNEDGSAVAVWCSHDHILLEVAWEVRWRSL